MTAFAADIAITKIVDSTPAGTPLSTDIIPIGRAGSALALGVTVADLSTAIIGSSASGQIPVGQPGGGYSAQTVSGGATLNSSGVLTLSASAIKTSLGTPALATGIIKNTTTTGTFTIANVSDFPTLNQNTTGTAANVTGVIQPVHGGTGLAAANVAAVLNGILPTQTGNQGLVLTTSGSAASWGVSTYNLYISLAASVTVSSGGTVNLFTVPGGYSFQAAFILIRTTSGVTGVAPTVSIGSTETTTTSLVTTAAVTGLAANSAKNIPLNSQYAILSPGDTVTATMVTPGTAGTFSVQVVGSLFSGAF